MKDSLVWYAAYGSNLAWDRFRCYIHGGTPAGSSKRYPGCRLNRDPEATARFKLSRPLYFACKSQTWDGGGVAFIGHVPAEDQRTLSRVFRIKFEQFEDICAQENAARPGSVKLDLANLRDIGWLDFLKRSWYRRATYCGTLDGIPVVTCTAAWNVDDVDHVAPSAGYLRWLVLGLQEAWDLQPADVAEYLWVCPGIADVYPTLGSFRRELEKSIRDSV